MTRQPARAAVALVALLALVSVGCNRRNSPVAGSGDQPSPATSTAPEPVATTGPVAGSGAVSAQLSGLDLDGISADLSAVGSDLGDAAAAIATQEGYPTR